MPCIRSLLMVALFLASTHLRADDWPVPRGPSREPLPYRYDPAVLKTIPREYLDDATACVIYTATTYLIEPDGTTESITHEITRLNSRKGIEKLGEYRSIYYDPTYEKLTLNEARVIKGDGKIVTIEPKHVQLRDVATDFQVYDQDKQLVISFPNLQAGDLYEVKWTVRGKHREFDGQFFSRYSFGDDTHPVLRDEFRVRVPKSKPLNHKTVNGKIDLVVTETATDKLYHWTVTKRPELPRDEERPSREELRLQVAVSTFVSWEAIGQWKDKLRANCWKCTPEIRKIVDEVTGNEKMPIDKAKALTYWVRRNVRYLSRGPGGLGYTPHQPHQVLASLYGDCKDQAQLLAVMLREIGLPVWLVTLGTLDDGQVQPAVPSPWGTHAILKTQIAGKDYWIDTTVSLAAWDFLPRSDRDRQAYLTQGKDLTLAKTPQFAAKDFRFEQITHVNVQPDGTARCRREATYFEGAAWSRRDRWLEVPPGERRRTIVAELQDAHPKVRLTGYKIDEKRLLDFDQPVKAEFEFDVPKHFIGETSKEASFTDSITWAWLIGYNLDMDRKLPFQLPSHFESSHRYVIQIPPAFRFDGYPDQKEIRSAFGHFRLRVERDPDDSRRIELHMDARLDKTRVEKAEFADFVSFQDNVSRAYRAWIYLRPTIDIADAPLLEKLLADDKQADAQSARILAKMYIDHERIDDARRVLELGTKRFPNEYALWDLRVKVATDDIEEQRIYRTLATLFPRDPKYALALGAVCVRRGESAEAEKLLAPLTVHALGIVRAAAHYQLARNADRSKEPAVALKHLQQALFIDSASLASVDALLLKARVHDQLNQTKDAISALKAGIEADANNRDALAYIILLELRLGRTDDALDHLRRLGLAAGKDRATLVRAADLYLDIGRPDEALELVMRAQEQGSDAAGRRIFGLLHFAKENYSRSAFDLEKGERDAKATAMLIHAHLRIGALDAAIQASAGTEVKLRESLLGLSEEVQRLARTRDTLLKQWNPADADRAAASRVVNGFVCAEYGLSQRWPIRHVEQLVDATFGEGIDFGPLLALRGWFRLERGQIRLALDDADAAIKLQPSDARAFLVRGRGKFEQAIAKDALIDLRKATALTGSKDAIVLHWLAAALHDSGRIAEAIETQRLALLLRPHDSALQAQLRRMERLSMMP
ncbi:MAG: DUF3857 domain-containing protein [Gemmataceae bacterium]|nr:DUF3857 domain-containing protein [Gemmataceae bacterium]